MRFGLQPPHRSLGGAEGTSGTTHRLAWPCGPRARPAPLSLAVWALIFSSLSSPPLQLVAQGCCFPPRPGLRQGPRGHSTAATGEGRQPTRGTRRAGPSSIPGIPPSRPRTQLHRRDPPGPPRPGAHHGAGCTDPAPLLRPRRAPPPPRR